MKNKRTLEKYLLAIAKQFHANTVSVEVLAKCKNTVYKAYGSDGLFVLRLTEERHRSAEQIKSELDFQKYLFDNGAAVSKPLQTTAGENCLLLETKHSRHLVSAFSYIDAKNWDERSDSEETFHLAGKALGKIHFLSKNYQPISVCNRRMWSKQQELLKAPSVFQNYSSVLYDQFENFMLQMNQAERNPDNFGLTHGDYLSANYLVGSDNRITVIDFDDCEYSWFAADLAIYLRCHLFWTEKPEDLPLKAKEAETLHYQFLSGYSTENKISNEMVTGLEKYIRIRDFIELAQLLTQKKRNTIERTLLKMNLDRVLNNRPFLIFDTSKAESKFL